MIRVERLRGSNLVEFIYRVLLYVVVAVGGIIFAIPFYWMVRTAIMPPWQIYIFPPQWIPAEIRLDSFREPFKVFPFALWFRNSALIAVINVIGAALSSSLVAFSFARLRTPFRDTIFVIVLSTMILPEHVRLVPTYLLFVKLGWVDTFYPLTVPNWFAPAFFVFLLRQFFMTIPKELDDAAFIDGCSPLGLYWRIHLPLSMPALGVVAIFMFTGSWNEFLQALIYLNKVKNFTVALGLRLFQGQLSTNMRALMAASILAVLPTVFIFFVAQRYFVQGIVISGVKG
jgi:ABC-type glycerol-3-phosphate transport system permease component